MKVRLALDTDRASGQFFFDAGELGFKIGFLDNLKNSLNNLKYNVEDESTLLQEADIAQIAIDLSRRDVLYQMSLSVAARLMSMSLLDFI